MKTTDQIKIFITVLIFATLTFCVEDYVVDQKVAPNNINPLPKVSSQISDSLWQKEKKEKIAKLRKEQEKPYVIIETPKQKLLDYLKTRNTNNNILKKATSSCETIEIEAWVLEKYHNKSGYDTGILPKFFETNQYLLSVLKNYYAFSKVILGGGAISVNTVYNPGDVFIDFDATVPNWVSEYCANYTGLPLGGIYVDEPFSKREKKLFMIYFNQNIFGKRDLGKALIS